MDLSKYVRKLTTLTENEIYSLHLWFFFIAFTFLQQLNFRWIAHRFFCYWQKPYEYNTCKLCKGEGKTITRLTVFKLNYIHYSIYIYIFSSSWEDRSHSILAGLRWLVVYQAWCRRIDMVCNSWLILHTATITERLDGWHI